MRWINTFAGCLGVILLAGCANQETLIPQTDNKMIDIYRGAMAQTGAGEVETIQPSSVCEQLKLDESSLSCQEKVGALVAQEYRRLDEVPPAQSLDYIPYTRTVDNELEVLFPRLANPDLAIYVYPHLATRTRAPIPGYTTVIPLYERVEYRLPGEDLRMTPTSGEAVEAARVEPPASPLAPTSAGVPASDDDSEVRYAKPGNLP